MNPQHRPDLFVDLKSTIPSLHIDLKYATSDNFMGTPALGYEQPRCWLTRPAAMALAAVEAKLAKFGLGLIIFDAYRPQRTVESFLDWTHNSEIEGNKSEFYPDIDKSELFSRGYLVARSSHSRGSTVDLTIFDLANGEPLDMGTCFDFFGEQSWLNAKDISPQARANRLLLQQVMVAEGFVPFDFEWWHFTLKDEPFPETYFDFPVEG